MGDHSSRFSDCGDSYNWACPLQEIISTKLLQKITALLQYKDSKVIPAINYVDLVPLYLSGNLGVEVKE